MKIWVYLNGIQQGPYNLDELLDLPVTASTPVWYEGLPQWMPAQEAPVTASLFAAARGAAEQQHQSAPMEVNAGFGDARSQDSYAAHATAMADRPKCPPTFMAWGIIILICCFPLGGILAMVFSALTSSSYSNGDFERARKMSERAEWTIIISIVLGLITAPFSWMLWL